MLRTPLCDLLGIDVPIIQAPAAPLTPPELVAAVSNAGGLGSYATGLRPLEQIERHVPRIRELTDQPFAVNFLMHAFDQEAFEFVMADPPSVVSFAAGAPEKEIKRAKDAGTTVMVQIHTVEQAREAASVGADALVAQGSEAGGLTGTISLMPLLPQVVDAVRPLPVIAAGGIADGRGMAAALVLGAQGVNIGTRFLASEESILTDEQRQTLLGAQSEDTVRATILDKIFPPPEGTFPVTLRSIRTSFLDEWEAREEINAADLDALRRQMNEAAHNGRMHEYVSGAGQSVGLIREILPAAEIVRRMVSEAETALTNAAGLVTPTA